MDFYYLKLNKLKLFISMFILIELPILTVYYFAFLDKSRCTFSTVCTHSDNITTFLGFFQGANIISLAVLILISIIVTKFYYITHSYCQFLFQFFIKKVKVEHITSIKHKILPHIKKFKKSIIINLLILIFLNSLLLIYTVSKDTNSIKNITETLEKTPSVILYRYPFQHNNKNHTIQLYYPTGFIEQSEIDIKISKQELLETEIFKFIFTSEKSSNGQVVKVSGRLFPFLKHIYRFPLIPLRDIISTDEFSCKNSTIKRKLIFFNANSTKNEVSYNKINGCITFNSKGQGNMGLVGDKFFLELITSKNIKKD